MTHDEIPSTRRSPSLAVGLLATAIATHVAGAATPVAAAPEPAAVETAVFAVG